MFDVEGKKVLVVGRVPEALAACRLLVERGAAVALIDPFAQSAPAALLQKLEQDRIKILDGRFDGPWAQFAVVIVTPGLSPRLPILLEVKKAGVQVLSDLELGYQQSRCLNVTISGTNGKTSAAALLAEVFRACDRKTVVVGNGGSSVCEAVDQTPDLDFLTIKASASQLVGTEFFRPSVAVLLNLAPDGLADFSSNTDYVRATAKLFVNQQRFDWAVVQSEACAQMHSLNLPMPGKVITFSAQNRRADIFLDRSLLISRLEDWAGPLLDLEQTNFQGPHHAENLMAVLAVSRVLRLPLESVIATLKQCKPQPHCCEMIAEIRGVQYVSDACSSNVDSLKNAVLSVPPRGEPNVWLIAGGSDTILEFHDIGPLLSQRVKGVFLVGESAPKLRAAWSLFTPCTVADSLLEALSQAGKKAADGDTVLFSPACSSFDDPQNAQHRGELFRNAVKALERTTGCGTPKQEHNSLIGTRGRKGAEPSVVSHI